MKFNSIPEMIRDRASTYSGKEVFRFFKRNSKEIQSKNWTELVEDFTLLAKVLLSEKYGFEDNIGIFSPNTPEWTVADLAILDIRAVVVPFFATASKEQCKYIVDETKMKLMFVGEQEQLDKSLWLLENTKSLKKVVVFNSSLTLNDERCIHLKDYVSKETSNEDELAKIQKEVKLADIATLIYTSGTTGEPKGVMLNNENFIHTFEVHVNRLDLHDKDLSMCFLPLSHIFERTWTFYLLYVGGTNFYLSNPREIIEILPIAKPTVMCTVPRFYEKTYEGIQKETGNWSSTKQKIFKWSIKIGGQVSEKKSNSDPIPALLKIKHNIADKLVLSKLRQIFGGNIRTTPCSGAALPTYLLKFFHATGIIVNYGYGATETTATVSCMKTDKYEFGTCGTVMPGLEIKIGAEDEIMVKGKTVFAGYYKKPEATAEVLVDGWYKTGDEGRITSDGNLIMTDRIKDLMKTSVGKYISPQKLETLIGQDEMIEQIVVVGDNRHFVTALIVPVEDKLKEVATNLGISFKDINDLTSNQQIREVLMDRINLLQAELTNYEKVKEFTILNEPFSIDNNMLTSTLKTKRKEINKVHSSVIEEMYSN